MVGDDVGMVSVRGEGKVREADGGRAGVASGWWWVLAVRLEHSAGQKFEICSAVDAQSWLGGCSAGRDETSDGSTLLSLSFMNLCQGPGGAGSYCQCCVVGSMELLTTAGD